ncbi:MAG: ATP-binding protein [Leptolyngbyaceae bacterium]|nr:ATP-binding protein [Leptolyngbyaceae bacterium]
MMRGQSNSSLSSAGWLPFAQYPLELECLTTLSYQSGELRAYLKEIVLSVSRFMQSDWTIITLCREENGQILASSLELKQEELSFSVHETLAEAVVQSGQLLAIEDNRQSSQYDNLAQEFLAYLGIPLRTPNRVVIGTICSFFRSARPFSESEVKVIELFAERAATAIENFYLYQQQLRFNERLSQQVSACSTDLKQSQEKLIEHERLAAVGEFTAMIVHEVRNPLTTIEMGLRYAQKVLHSDAAQQRLALALDESQRLKHLLAEILSYAKPQVLQCSKLNIDQFFDDLLIQIQDLPEATERHIAYVNDAPDVAVMADVNKLKQVFLNLFRNAFEAIAPQERVTCSVDHGIRANWVGIHIHNGGTPIPPELLPQLTTPFCSTKPSGTGLGLAISKQIITAHGGELEITSSSTETTVSVYLPIMPCDCIIQ